MASETPARVLITGAAGQIAYSLVFSVARGEFLGASTPVILHLLDIPMCEEGLRGVVMEIEDCALPLVAGIVATTDVNVAFKDVDYCLLVGAFPRRPGMERKDLLEKNAAIFKQQGEAINSLASRNVKVCVVGNPANTNCLIAQSCAPDIPKENFSALTRLDHNRALYQIAHKTGVKIGQVKNVTIWGNHSSTQYPDVSHGSVTTADGASVPITDAVNDAAWLTGEFITTVQQRGAAVMNTRKLSSAASAAKAIVDHMRDWVFGTAPGQWVSMAVVSDGTAYDVPAGIVYSFPVTTADGRFTIVPDLSIDAFSREKMTLTAQELLDEKQMAFSFLGLQNRQQPPSARVCASSV